jgi:putative membrane protein
LVRKSRICSHEVIIVHDSDGIHRFCRSSFRSISTRHQRVGPTAHRDGSSGRAGRPVAALTQRDAEFIAAQLENNTAEVLAAQRALEHSQNPNVRGFAQKMITDHNYAQSTLEPIASMHQVPPVALSDLHREMLDRLSQLSGSAFDREYVNSMVNEHALEITEFNTELPVVVDAHVSAWVQNTRPMLLQHHEIAQQLLISLPGAG